ncbi:sulfotransferase domain-containing protein [Pseudorhodoplanes sinuspersici]|uniref:Uncharacterized protein n=1 Tax=Pseudorhodoplanes sinuspersici TaxID=1235591 RepID=A0A1W6ZVD2_9HYPH|nr:sulfotransferase domain-containing protein [Pseudorhodoplanes sinuspersici]ARQ00715.1 hypothetical protein CAK95_17710 [Pseudorhodoplanes sinuspersici]RKE72323.1 hypothetical protein DFP91_0186 [Pseudorhodoplanes sinuspersici]
MKRLLLHVGYPKSASTSLQNGLFLGLHKAGAINFLGRAFESDFYGEKQSKGLYKIWFDHVLASGPYQANPIGELSKCLPNVLSEGLFMMNERRHERIIGPAVLHKYFTPHADKVGVLIVIRKQQDLIPSYYVQNYRRFENVFSDFLTRHKSEDWKGETKIFNFHEVAKAYAAVFGKDDVHIVFFEDFVRNRSRFSEQLGCAMGVDPAVVQSHLGDGHLNEAPKKANAVMVRKPSKFSGRLTKISEKLGLGLADFFQVPLPPIADKERAFIQESFRDSNLRLAEDFALDKQTMQSHGYF